MTDQPDVLAPLAQPAAPAQSPISRRTLLKAAAVGVPCLIGGGAIFEALSALTSTPVPTVDPIVANYDAAAHRWGFVVDAVACIGCGKCVVACKTENGVPLDEEHTRTWIERRTVTTAGAVIVQSPEAGSYGFEEAALPIAAADVAASQFVARLCMQCELSPCTTVCPVGATFRAADGVILVDETRCIGCGYCVVACPYGARYLVPAGARTPTGVAGVADKCTFCYHRVTRGQQPACVEVCPVQARKFGDLNDPASEVSVILRDRATRVLRPELGTKPRVHYLGLEDRLA
ncbi:MAG TPA: 4Fe-4S dicluster domain-containing protein [Candidatus Limnocylindrales bacterium]|nr:4Fe-4S dicluster domain-containing protein [Candidatus Limnocylindrales bacterium]